MAENGLPELYRAVLAFTFNENLLKFWPSLVNIWFSRTSRFENVTDVVEGRIFLLFYLILAIERLYSVASLTA